MYDRIEDVENKLLSARAKKATVEAEGITADNIYRILLQFDKLYDHMNEDERRALVAGLISEIQIFPERQPDGRWLKSIRFRLPILPEPMETGLEYDPQAETVVSLSQLKSEV
jgi:site-specific DNA recombinase